MLNLFAGRLEGVLLVRADHSFRSEMALFRNFGVKRRYRFCGVKKYASVRCRRFP